MELLDRADRRRGSTASRAAVVAALVAAVAVVLVLKGQRKSDHGLPSEVAPEEAGLPRLVDIGSTHCIPCKLMAPVLEGLRRDFAGKLAVVFLDTDDVAQDRRADAYGYKLIPTQVFLDSAGKEVYRHEGFIGRDSIISKWKELGVDLPAGRPPDSSGEEPAAKDGRAPDARCSMCDGTIDGRTRVTVDSSGGKAHLCSPHCLFIVLTSLKDRGTVAGKVAATDWATGALLSPEAASYLVSTGPRGRPVIRTFASAEAATAERTVSGGDVVPWADLEARETAVRCAFCDRATYPADSCPVRAEGVALHACCPMCGLGVAARLGKDIELEVRDGLTGEPVKVKTLNGSVAELSPAAAVAWHGQKRGPDGKMASAGCFKQCFFASEANLAAWVEKHPEAAGKQMTIVQALVDKMNLTPAQIAGACKMGECLPAR